MLHEQWGMASHTGWFFPMAVSSVMETSNLSGSLQSYKKTSNSFKANSWKTVPGSSMDEWNFLLVCSYDPKDVKNKTLLLSRPSKFRLVCLFIYFLKFLGIIDTLIQSQIGGLLLGTTWQFSFLESTMQWGKSFPWEPESPFSGSRKGPYPHLSKLAGCRDKSKEELLSFPRDFSEWEITP